MRTPEGKLVISGGPEHRSALLVNSVDVTDPATGRFGATVPIDIVERLNVYKAPFLAEYGRFEPLHRGATSGTCSWISPCIALSACA